VEVRHRPKPPTRWDVARTRQVTHRRSDRFDCALDHTAVPEVGRPPPAAPHLDLRRHGGARHAGRVRCRRLGAADA
jgi:hypothetical protein